jgi:hypothetical protein
MMFGASTAMRTLVTRITIGTNTQQMANVWAA